MSKLPAPRVFLVRHGETEWSSKELHSGSTDLVLTDNGQSQVRKTSQELVGDGKLIDLNHLMKMLSPHLDCSQALFECSLTADSYTSPRTRARQTVELLDLVAVDRLPWDRTIETKAQEPSSEKGSGEATVRVLDDLQEWKYGAYEGLAIADIRRMRQEKGQDEAWNIWRDGCEGGESPAQVAERLDRVIADIQKQFESVDPAESRTNVVCVGHSHVLSAFALRWVRRPLEEGTRLLLDTAGVAVLSYDYHDLSEPAIIIGRRF